MLRLMIDKLVERKERVNEAMSNPRKQGNVVSDESFFRQMGNKIKVVKKK